MGDRRDERTWVTLELARSGEVYAVEGTLAAHIRRDLQVDEDHEVFVPVALFRKNNRVVPIHLVEGYAFVASGLDDVAYYALEREPYINQVMSSRTGPHRMRCLSVVPNFQVEAMRDELRRMVTAEVPLHAMVNITQGAYRGLEGRVCGLDEDNAFIRIRLRSLEVVATVPRIFIEEQVGD